MLSCLYTAEAKEHVDVIQNAMYYFSLTFHRITALYVKHSPSMLAVMYGASGPASEAFKHKQLTTCYLTVHDNDVF